MSVEPPKTSDSPVVAASKVAAAVRPPMPPPLLRRIGLLCVLPEQWPQAARYRLSATVWPVVVVSVVMSLLVALTTARGVVRDYSAFASAYDGKFFPMELKGGKLFRVNAETQPATHASTHSSATRQAASAPATQPALVTPTLTIREFPDGPGSFKPLMIVFDPDNREHVQVPDGTIAMRITESEMVVTEPESFFDEINKLIFGHVQKESRRTWQDAVTALGQEQVYRRIDGASLGSDKWRALVAVGTFGATMIYGLISNLFWAVLAAFFVMPMVAMASPRLNMPRFVAYRIALAGTVPLIVIGGVLQMTGCGVQQLIPTELLPAFWLACLTALAVWSGMMANRMYAVRKQAPRRGT